MPPPSSSLFPPPYSASRHAVERYQLHFPEADTRDVLTAAQLALPIPSEAAHALLGRPSARPSEENEHRLHLEGAGVFVLSRLPERDHSYIITYLRLDGAEQRRIAREWFLQPLQALRAAFELGVEAARGRPPAPHKENLAGAQQGDGNGGDFRHVRPFKPACVGVAFFAHRSAISIGGLVRPVSLSV